MLRPHCSRFSILMASSGPFVSFRAENAILEHIPVKIKGCKLFQACFSTVGFQNILDIQKTEFHK